MISCPQILIQIGDACRPKRLYRSTFPAILDTGSTINLIRRDCLPKNTRVMHSNLSFIGISGKKSVSKGMCKICIRPLNPMTKAPLCEIRRPVICQLTDDLPSPMLLGTSFLNKSIIDLRKQKILIDLGHKMVNVSFTRNSCLLVQEPELASELTLAIEKSQVDGFNQNELLDVTEIKINPSLSKEQNNKIKQLLNRYEN